MRQNFFEVIGMADVERVHSQTLAWIFASDVLLVPQKATILGELSGYIDDYSVCQVHTEYDGVDILVETDRAIIVIENKIKITVHDDQLSRYEAGLSKHKLPRRYVYLSLFPEIIDAQDWKQVTYGELCSILSRHRFSSPQNCDEHIFNEYIEAISRLHDAVKSFEQDHTRFLNVFTDGSHTKHAKRLLSSSYTDLQQYVSANQLETPFQRRFLTRVRDSIVSQSVKCRVEETRGVALLHIILGVVRLDGRHWEVGVQFQDRTAKLFCCAVEYQGSTLEQLPIEIRSTFRQAAEKHSLKLNLPRSKAYISVSKRMDFSWSDPLDKILKAFNSSFTALSEIGQNINFQT